VRACRVRSGSCRFTPSAFNHYVLLHPNTPGFDYSGLGTVSGPNVWLNGQYEAMKPVLAHEVGHNFGLLHANTWTVAGGNKEYGDTTDNM